MSDDKEKVFLRRTVWGFEPAFDRDIELLRRFPKGCVVSAQPRRPRNGRRHRWWWALLSKVADSHPFYSRPEQVGDHIKYRTGWVDTSVLVIDDKVQTIFKPRSIAYDAMDEAEFGQFLDRALDVVVTELLPGIDREELRSEIEMMIGPDERRTAA